MTKDFPWIDIRPIAALCVAMFAACGGQQASGPAEGTPEWYWDAAKYNFEKGDFPKAQEQLEEVAKSESELAPRAALWRAVILFGLAQGSGEIAGAYRSAIAEKESTRAVYQTMVQQHDRRAKQYSIAFAESLGHVDKAMQGEKVPLEFPFPSGSAVESPVLQEVSGGVQLTPEKLAAAEDHEISRQLMFSVARFAGAADDTAKAQSMFEAGPVEVDKVTARTAVARDLLDLSKLFDRKRLADPKIRGLLLDRSEQWIAAAKEVEGDKELAEVVADFEFDVENERRDIAGKARWKERRK